MNDLILHLKTVYFNDIQAGKKKEEYRLYNDYWKKRLYENGRPRSFNNVIIFKGYPAFEDWDESNRIVFPWQGFTIGLIYAHPQFGGVTSGTTVFKIPLIR